MEKENKRMKQLVKYVNKENELLSWSDIEQRIGGINEENPNFSSKQIIESQIALLETLLLYKSTDI